jgi:hypothetical protein
MYARAFVIASLQDTVIEHSTLSHADASHVSRLKDTELQKFRIRMQAFKFPICGRSPTDVWNCSEQEYC